MSHSLLHHRGQMSEAFRTVMFLSASGGLQDAYTYIAVSYTHLDVYKRQIKGHELAAAALVAAAEHLVELQTDALNGRQQRLEACLLYTSRCV